MKKFSFIPKRRQRGSTETANACHSDFPPPASVASPGSPSLDMETSSLQEEQRDLQERLTLIQILIFIKPLSRVGHLATDALGLVISTTCLVLVSIQRVRMDLAAENGRAFGPLTRRTRAVIHCATFVKRRLSVINAIYDLTQMVVSSRR